MRIFLCFFYFAHFFYKKHLNHLAANLVNGPEQTPKMTGVRSMVGYN